MNQTYLNSTRNAVFSLKPSKAIRLLLMVLFVSLFANVINAATKTSVGSGNWNMAATWSPSGVPQAGDDVVISVNHTILVSGNISIKSVTINGVLLIEGVVYVSFITSVIVNNNLKFVTNSSSLHLPLNTTLDINSPGKIDSSGGCSNNVAVFIGLTKIAVCRGNGGDPAYDFGQINAAGGTLQSLPASNAPVCYGSPLTFTANKNGATGDNLQYIWSIKDPNNVITTTTLSTYTIANPVAGTYLAMLTYTTTYSDNVYTSVKTIGAEVVPLPTAPKAGNPTQPDCKTATGSVELSGLPASGTIHQTGKATATYTITGVTMTISGLVTGTYNFSVSNRGCSSLDTDDVVIYPAVTNTWNFNVVTEVGSWSEGTPISSQAIIFNGDYNQDKDVEACSCTINEGVNVDIESGKTLKLTNELISNGRILFKDKSSLVQINDVSNEGNIEYERKISNTIRSTDYIYWSSPVAGFELGDVYPTSISGLFYSYGVTSDEEDWQRESSETIMGKGIGYIINGAKPGPNQPPTFIGVPNNGTISFPVGYTGATTEGTSNLLGNPYPSAIDADKFLAANATILDGTLYFWTHNTALDLAGNIINPGLGWAFTYSLNDYASYNLTGGVGIQNAKAGVSAPSDPLYPLPTGIIDLGNKPSGKIAAGQGFFATSTKAGNVTFTNEMRVAGTSGNNSQFFKTKNLKGKTSNITEKNRLWLNLTNTQGAFKQTLIGYVTGATNDYDNLFDGQSFDANEFVDFYSVYQDKNLVIQGRALPFEETDEVQLGFRTTIDGTFTINIDEVDGVLTNQAVFIEDKLTNTIFDLKSGDYTFSTAPGTFNDRFVLRYNNKTLGTENFDSLTNKVLISNANKQIKINSFAETIDKIIIYDLLGRQIYQKANVNSNELSISNMTSSRQVIIVKTLLQNGQEVRNKIVY